MSSESKRYEALHVWILRAMTKVVGKSAGPRKHAHLLSTSGKTYGAYHVSHSQAQEHIVSALKSTWPGLQIVAEEVICVCARPVV